MAFSLSKMLKNITYFKKPEEDVSRINDGPGDPNAVDLRHAQSLSVGEPAGIMSFMHTEPDSTSSQTAALKLTESTKTFAAKKDSLSDTNLLNININTANKKDKRKAKKLKLNIEKAKSFEESLNHSESDENVENTPKQYHLESKNSEIFSERMKQLDFSQSFDLFSAMEEQESVCEEENLDIESLSDSDTEISVSSEENIVKLCRKVAETEHNQSSTEEENQIIPSASPESFGDVEIDKNEEERISLLLNYQMKLEKMECFLKKLLNEFQFHIEVSKVFNCRSIVTTLPGANVNDIPKKLGEITYMDNISRGVSPSWNIIMEKEDDLTKQRLRNQLLSIKQAIEKFVNDYLNFEVKKAKFIKSRTIAYDFNKEKKFKRLKVSNKKKTKRYDFPDIREAMINLFGSESDKEDLSISGNNITQLLSDDDHERSKCVCRCHVSESPLSETDSGVNKSNERSFSITSSIGNFSLDSSTLTAYSESLDQIISYNSFQDTSLFSSILQKAAIERVTFYVQVHSIQLRCEISEQEFESKNVIKFHCPACNITETDENGLLKHIMSQYHCEKLHFLYKTAYIKRCMQTGKEIQPSTVLNPMKMYRDDNKIVCFGDAMYACSLCFENIIIGESVLMAHCSEAEHADRRERLCELLD